MSVDDKIHNMLFESDALNEAPAWWDDHKNIGTQLGKLRYTPDGEIIKKESVDGHDWIWSEVGDELKLEIVKGGVVYGMFTFVPSSMEGVLQVELAALYASMRGKGYAVKAYSDVINSVGGLMSDSTLTGESGDKGSFHVWEKLGTIFTNTYVFTADSHTGGIHEVEGFSRDMMGNVDEFFIVSKEPLGVVAEGAKMKSKILKLFCEAMELDEGMEPSVVSSLDAHTPHNARIVSQYLEPVSGPVSEYIKTTIPKKLYYLNKTDILGPGIHKVVEEYGYTSPFINSGAEMKSSGNWGEFQDEYIEKIGGYDIYYDGKNPEDSVIYKWLEESNKKYNLGKEFDQHVDDLSLYDPDSPCISSYSARYWTFFILRDGYFFTTPQKIIDEWEKKYMVSIIQTYIDGGSFHEYFRYHPSIFAVGFDDDLVSDRDILEMLSKTTIKADFEDEAVRRFKMRNTVRSGD